MKSFSIICLLLLMAVTTAFSQENPFKDVEIASSDVAALSKHTLLSVGNHTGIPSISILIYAVALPIIPK